MEEEEGGLCRSVPAVPNFRRRPKPTIPLHSKCIKDQLCFWHHAFSTNRSPTISSSIQSSTRRGELYLCEYVSTSSTRVVEKFVVCGRHLRKTFRRCLRLSDGSDFLISSHSHVTPRPFPYLSPFIGHRSPSLWISRYISILDFCPNHSGDSISTDTDLRSLLLA